MVDGAKYCDGAGVVVVVVVVVLVDVLVVDVPALDNAAVSC